MSVRKAPKGYLAPPANHTRREYLKVGLLNRNFATYPGPQRNRPQDSARYRASLAGRAKAYGPFSWALLRDRVVSRRADGVLYPLDGNGSNHWIEDLFGPDFEVPCIVVDDLNLPDENRLFQRLQDNKKVTPTEKYRTDLEYDHDSLAAKIQQALPEGFHVTQSPLDAFGIARTSAEWIVRKYGVSALTEALKVVTSLFSEAETARTNGALVKALAVLLNNADEREAYDLTRLLPLLQQAGPAQLTSHAHGSGAESLVLARMREIYLAAG